MRPSRERRGSPGVEPVEAREVVGRSVAVQTEEIAEEEPLEREIPEVPRRILGIRSHTPSPISEDAQDPWSPLSEGEMAALAGGYLPEDSAEETSGYTPSPSPLPPSPPPPPPPSPAEVPVVPVPPPPPAVPVSTPLPSLVFPSLSSAPVIPPPPPTVVDRELYVHRSLLVAATRDQDMVTGRLAESRRIVDDLIDRVARPQGGGGSAPLGLMSSLVRLEMEAQRQVRQLPSTSDGAVQQEEISPIIASLMGHVRELIRSAGM